MPLGLIVAINMVVDPFGFNSKIDFGFKNESISRKLNQRLFAILEFRTLKTANILLGDSRIAAISTNEIKRASGEEYYNLSYGSATLPECFETFWYADSLTHLKRVYLGIPFNLFSATNSNNSFLRALKIAASPLDYYLNFFIFKVSILNILFETLHVDIISDTPEMAPGEYWQAQLASTGNAYRAFRWPQDSIQELMKIKRYCLKKNIEFTILIPPSHLDLQKLVSKYGLQKEYANYKTVLRSIAPVIDYDKESKLTIDKANFKDPYHFDIKTMKTIVREIWGRKKCRNMEG